VNITDKDGPVLPVLAEVLMGNEVVCCTIPWPTMGGTSLLEL